MVVVKNRVSAVTLTLNCGEANSKNIGVTAVNGAIKLVEYFRTNALIINSMIHLYLDI